MHAPAVSQSEDAFGTDLQRILKQSTDGTSIDTKTASLAVFGVSAAIEAMVQHDGWTPDRAIHAALWDVVREARKLGMTVDQIQGAARAVLDLCRSDYVQADPQEEQPQP